MNKTTKGVVLASLLLAGCTTQTTTPPPPKPSATLTKCTRDAEGYVRVAGQVNNPWTSVASVEVTVNVYDALTGKYLDYTQAKVNSMQPGAFGNWQAAVYDVNTGLSSIPYYVTIKCGVVGVKVMDPTEIG